MSKAWDVILDGEVIDTVFFNDGCDKEYVRASLIDHDGYDPSIEVREDTNS